MKSVKIIFSVNTGVVPKSVRNDSNGITDNTCYTHPFLNTACKYQLELECKGPEQSSSSSCVQSVIVPMHSASCWLGECLQGLLHQDFTGSIELSVYDDASTVSVCKGVCVGVRVCVRV